jgi:hypothetical protein
MEPYLLQESASDQKRRSDGLRTFHWAKDLSLDPHFSTLTSNHVVAMVDVDHYYDMPGMLAAYPHIYLVATFQPTAVTHSGEDYSFRFLPDNMVHYAVSGGAVYEHKVWNYGSDIIIALCSTILGYQCTVYTITRKKFDDHHCLILLQPTVSFWSPLLNPSRWVKGSVLERLVVHDNGFNRLDVQTTAGLMRSTSRVGTWVSATVPVELDDVISTTSRLNSTALTVAQVKTLAKSDDAVQAAVLTEYHRQNPTSKASPPLVFPPSESVFHYQFVTPSYDSNAKQSMHAFMSPIVHGAYVPMRAKSNDERAVSGRVLEVKAPADIKVTPFIVACMTEFVSLLVPEGIKHLGHPVDIPEVYERQNRPSQRMLLHQVENLPDDISNAKVVTFQKTETYQKPSDPRIISTIPTTNKLHYSTFTYAFSEYLRSVEWYAFGKTPKQISQRVADICSKASRHVAKTDLSRMDGHVSSTLRMLERCIMQRFFAESYHGDLLKLMDTQHSRKAVTGFGIKYDTGYARLSGSPETADFNSIDNAFGSYMALRKTVFDGAVLNPEQAWNLLGLFGGDDGLQGDVDPDEQQKAYSSLGQELEIEIVLRGALGVDMLSRKYGPDVWYGSANNMCDIARQLSKLHVSISLPSNVTPSQKLATKLFSYYLTDRNTPIIGELASLVVSRYADLIINPSTHPEIARQLMSYYSQHPAKDNFINERQDWMFDVIRADMPDFDEGLFHSWLRECRVDPACLLRPPLCQPVKAHPPVKHPVDIAGDIQVPEKKDSERKPAKICRHFAAGKCTWADKCKFLHSNA